MSISGSQEVKSALVQVHPAADSELTESLDAQEDREVVGWHAQGHVPQGAAAPDVGQARMRASIGTSQFADPASGESTSQDNLGWHVEARFYAMDDDTNQKAVSDTRGDGEWFGHGSGVEWNEDSTLNVHVNTSNSAGSVILTLYYREL